MNDFKVQVRIYLIFLLIKLYSNINLYLARVLIELGLWKVVVKCLRQWTNCNLRFTGSSPGQIITLLLCLWASLHPGVLMGTCEVTGKTIVAWAGLWLNPVESHPEDTYIY